MFNTILFDLDGTLTDPKEGITKSVQYALSFFGIDEPDLDKLVGFIGPPLDESFMEYYGFDKETTWKAIDRFRQRFSEIGKFENKAFDGIHEMLSVLKQSGKRLAVSTSKPEVFALEILEKYKLIDFFDVVCGCELDGSRVNKAEVIEETFRRLKTAERESSVMVGDRIYDITGAKKCGIKSIGVKFGYAKEAELENSGADFIVDKIPELTELLLS